MRSVEKLTNQSGSNSAKYIAGHAILRNNIQSVWWEAHYSLTVKSSPVSIDKIKFLFQLVNKDVTMSQDMLYML